MPVSVSTVIRAGGSNREADSRSLWARLSRGSDAEDPAPIGRRRLGPGVRGEWLLRERPSGVAFGVPGKPGEAHAATQRAPIARSERAGPGAMVARLHKRQRSKLSKWVPVRSNRAKLAEAHRRRPGVETNDLATTCHTGCGEVIATASARLIAPVPKADVPRGMHNPPATMVHVLRSLSTLKLMLAREE